MSNTKVSQEKRNRIMYSNPRRRDVKTPAGVFPSIQAAARHHGIAGSAVVYYCEVGDAQRSGKKPIYSDLDMREWEILTKSEKHAHKIAVSTPLGIFESMVAAAAAHNITVSAVSQKIKRGTKNWTIIK